jgi:hypothetical protein
MIYATVASHPAEASPGAIGICPLCQSPLVTLLVQRWISDYELIVSKIEKKDLFVYLSQSEG